MALGFAFTSLGRLLRVGVGVLGLVPYCAHARMIVEMLYIVLPFTHILMVPTHKSVHSRSFTTLTLNNPREIEHFSLSDL